MNLFTSAGELAEFDRHEDVGVRRLAADVRTLAAETLLAQIEEIGRQKTGERRSASFPFLLWRALGDVDARIPEEDAARLLQLAELSDSWWMFDSADGVEQVPLSEWRRKVSGL